MLLHMFQEKKIINFLNKLPYLAQAYLFGSQAKGQAKGTSDWDLALLFEQNKQPSFEEKLNLQAQLEDLSHSEVDLIILNQANPILKYQIYSHGKVLLNKNSKFAQKFLVKSLNEYDDVKYVRQKMLPSLSRGVLHG